MFTTEKKICDQIYEGVDSLKSQCFAEVTASSVAMLLSFGEAIAKSKRSPEKLFVLLDMYEIMRELQPEVFSCLYFRTSSKKLIFRTMFYQNYAHYLVLDLIDSYCKGHVKVEAL